MSIGATIRRVLSSVGGKSRRTPTRTTTGSPKAKAAQTAAREVKKATRKL